MNARDSVYSHFLVSNTDSVVPRRRRGGEERVAQRAAHAEERCVVHRGRVLARMLIIVDVDLVLLFVIVDVEEKDKLYVY
jgi:hypothetical protein